MKTDEKFERVITLLNRADIDYLDTIGKDSLFTTGTKLSRIKIIRAMIEAVMELGIKGRGIGNEAGLKEEILKKAASHAVTGLKEKRGDRFSV
ncbi:MAG: hypothetical protein Q8N91_02220 [Candidatus Omnitrophota bacterium]|nr:hypothetical protein [Candidatus Omnitrophota bacterium]